MYELNYCKNFRTRTKNKKYYYYCIKQRKVIDKEECCRCKYKEYKTKIKKNSFYKSDIMISNYNQINNSASSLQNTAEHYKKMKSKSNKLAKLEKSRKSVFTDNMDKCYLCSNKRTDIHEIFRGRNRRNSMIYGFVLPLCRECHSTKAKTIEFEDFWHKNAQLYFEENIGSREEFIKIFRRNYLD